MAWQHRHDPLIGDITWFNHEVTDIIGIKGQPFLDLSRYCTFDLTRIDEEVCQYLSQANISNIPMVNGEMPPEFAGDHRPFEFEYLGRLTDDALLRKMSKWSPARRRRYLFFTHRITLPWNFVVVLKQNLFATRSKDLYPWEPDVAEHLPYTQAAILSLPFKQIGRVVIYGSWPHMAVPCHRDDVPGEFRDHHINFNPGGARPVYVYDSAAKNGIYIPPSVKLYAYNTSDYHGVDAMDRFSYTIRVDGQYDASVLA